MIIGGFAANGWGAQAYKTGLALRNLEILARGHVPWEKLAGGESR